jgi:adducin
MFNRTPHFIFKIRSQENPNHFLINPFGLLYSEITAASLIKIDSKCNVIETGSTTFGINKAGFTLHSTIHDARQDLNAVLHIHTPVAAGLAALKSGLLPISQEAFICGKVGYHDYEGILVDE